jgi:hypothetical protein
MRTFSVLVATLVLVGCDRKPAEPPATDTIANRIECAVGKTAMAQDCAVERHGDTITVIAPNGGFRRFRSAPGGWTAADGAEPVTAVPGSSDVVLGQWRVRLPAP